MPKYLVLCERDDYKSRRFHSVWLTTADNILDLRVKLFKKYDVNPYSEFLQSVRDKRADYGKTPDWFYLDFDIKEVQDQFDNKEFKFHDMIPLSLWHHFLVPVDHEDRIKDKKQFLRLWNQ